MLYFWANLGFAAGKIPTVVISLHFGFGGFCFWGEKKQNRRAAGGGPWGRLPPSGAGSLGRAGLVAAAFLRFASSRASTSATCASIAGWLSPFCLAMSCTSLSARSILGAPFCNARAAEAGRVRLCAAAAYFSNGTRSSGLAPSLTHR